MILYQLTYLLGLSANSRSLFTENQSLCNNKYIGDGHCDPECMMNLTNYDSKVIGFTEIDALLSSDCITECLSTNCTIALLQNDICNSECNISICGWDKGACGFCVSGCYIENLTNSLPDVACNFSSCRYDNNEFGWCAPGCYLENLTNPEFIRACNNSECNYQNGIGLTYECSSGCTLILLQNNYCDAQCNNFECNYDNNNCLCSPNCTDLILKTSTCYVDDPCLTLNCNYKNGKCGTCAINCTEDKIGNGICNEECFNTNCSYDGGDCTCAKGCDSLYDGSKWIQTGGCKQECLVESCLFNYQSCNDANYIRAGILNNVLNLAFNTFSLNDENCTFDDILNFNDNNLCNFDNPCNSISNLYCNGYVNSSTSFLDCAINNGTNCIFRKNTAYLYLKEVDDLNNIPMIFTSISNLSSTISDTIALYFLNAGLYKKADPFTINLNPFTNNDFYSALVQARAPYTMINLESGNYTFATNKTAKGYFYLDSVYDPLSSTIPFENLYELNIQGHSPEDTFVFFYSKMIISGSANLIYISNITLSGEKLLKLEVNNTACYIDFCYYCASASEIYTNIYINDRHNEIPEYDISSFNLNCNPPSKYYAIAPLTPLYLNNVRFMNFRNQLSGLIQASASLYITNSTFIKLQPSQIGSVISFNCISNCYNINLIMTDIIVTDFNYGYEHSNTITQGVFLDAYFIGNIQITNVNFTFNMAISCQQCTWRYFIYFHDIQGEISINNCHFENIYTNTLIYIDSTNLVYEDYTIDMYSQRIQYAIIHISITNTLFANIYASNLLIDIEMDINKQNIKIINSTFKDIVTTGNGILHVDGKYATVESENLGITTNWIFDDKRYIITFPKRTMLIDNVHIFDIKYAGKIIDIEYYSNAIINNLEVINCGQVLLADPFEYVITNFKDANKYLSLQPQSSEISISECEGILSIANTYSISINKMNISESLCDTSYSSFVYISNIINSVNITSYACFDTYNIKYSSSYGLALHLVSADTINIINLNVQSIFNQIEPVIYIGECNRVYLSNIYLNNVTSISSAVFYIDSPLIVDVSNFICISCINFNCDNGLVMLNMSPLAQWFVLQDLNFYRSQSIRGKGLLHLTTPVYASFYAHINYVYIEHSLSFEGIIYISNTISFETSSLIENLYIQRTDSGIGGIIEDYHYGELWISNFTSIYNKGYCIGILASYIYRGVSLWLNNSIFNNQQDQNNTFIFTSIGTKPNVIFENVTIQNNQAQFVIQLSGIILQGDSLYLVNVSGGIKMDYVSSFLFQNSIFYLIESNGFMITESYVWCSNCSFSFINDTICSGSANSYFVFEGCNFTNSFSTSVSVLLMIKSESNFTNCIIDNNTVTGTSTFWVQQSNLSISNCTILNNRASSSSLTSGILSYAGTLYIENSVFLNHNINILYLMINSTAYIVNSTFSDCNSATLGAVIFADSSFIWLVASTFENIVTTSTGGVVYLFSTQLSILNCSFANNKASSGDSIYATLSEITIKYSRITNFDNDYFYSIALTLSSATITSVFFSSNNNCSGAIGATGGILIIDSVNFSGMSNSIGPGITASNSYIVISNSIFTNNKATGNGGAIYVDSSNLIIIDTIISNNSAMNSGGGIYYFSSDCASCLCTIEGSTFIIDNWSNISGGGISWDDRKPNVSNTVVIEHNLASYGDNYAAYPVIMMPFSNSRILTDQENIYTLENIDPGQLFTDQLLIGLYDSYGNLVTIQNSGSAIILSGGNITITGQVTATANKGIFNFTNFYLFGYQGSTHYIFINTTLINVDKKLSSGDNVTYNNSIIIRVIFRNCTYGEKINIDSCVLCPGGKYLIEPEDVCKTCPTGAMCNNGSNIYPIEGYWRVSNFTDILYSCPISDACLGFNNNYSNYIGTCAVGYYGNLCGACEIGYSLSSSGKCSRCPSPELNIVISLLLIIFVLSIIVILVKSTLKSAFSPTSLYSIYIKIFTNYLQIILVTTQFNLSWPSYVIQLFSIQKSAATASDQIFSIDCYFNKENSNNIHNVYFYKVIFAALLPFIISIISFIVWLFICFAHNTNDYLKRELFTTIIVIFFLVHPNIVKTIFGSVSCRSISGIGYWLMDDLEIQCWNLEHINFVLIITLPCIILWVFGIPTITLLTMIKRRKNLSKDYNRIVFGFLFNGYKHSKFFWEFIILYRKILMICISVFMTNSSTLVQALTVILVLFIALYLQFTQKPYNCKELNNMELEAIITATITIYCGIYYLSNAIDIYSGSILFIIILCGNLYFLVYWLYYLFRELFYIIIIRLPLLKKYFKIGDSFTENFYEERLSMKGIQISPIDGTRSFTFISTKNKQIFHDLEGINTMDDFYKVIMNVDDLSANIDESDNLI